MDWNTQNILEVDGTDSPEYAAEPPESPIASRQKSNNVVISSPSAKRKMFASTTNILANETIDDENTENSQTSHNPPPSWFANLEQKEQDVMVELLTQACNQYGNFTNDAKQDVIAKFQISENQAQELFHYVYQSPNSSTMFSPVYRDSVLEADMSNIGGSDHDLAFENDEEAYHHILLLSNFERPPYHGAPKLPQISDKNKYTLCLDLDETLVHCNTNFTNNADLVFDLEFGGNLFQIAASFRPHLQEFLQTVSQWYEITIFTASQKVYADRIINYIDPDNLISHRLYRHHCTNVCGNYVKDLSTLGRDLKTTVFVDNSPQAFSFQLNNSIPILSWYNDKMDEELVKLRKILCDIRKQPDVQIYLNQTFGIEDIVKNSQHV